MFGFVERFIVAKFLDLTRDYWWGDQVALQALGLFCDEELKHQELFKRLATEIQREHAGLTLEPLPGLS